MKIVDLPTFLSLPEGTLFTKYRRGNCEELNIKGSSLPETQHINPDFFFQPIADAFDAQGSGHLMKLLHEAENNKTSIGMDFNCQMRDGLYEESQLFAVWEEADVEDLIFRLQAAFRRAYRPVPPKADMDTLLAHD